MASPWDDLVDYVVSPALGKDFPSQPEYLDLQTRPSPCLCMEVVPKSGFSSLDHDRVEDRNIMEVDLTSILTHGAHRSKGLSPLKQSLDNSSLSAHRSELSPSRPKNGGFSGLEGKFREFEDKRPEVSRLKKIMWCIREKFGLVNVVVGVYIPVMEVSQYAIKLLVGRFSGKTTGTKAPLNWI